MGKTNRLHVVYTLQIKAKSTKQSGADQVKDLLESVNDTLKIWFPNGEVELAEYDVSAGDKRVVITNVLPAVVRRTPGRQTNSKGEEASSGE